MKKAIALFSVAALALALAPALAGTGNYAAGTDIDDSVFTQIRTRRSSFNFGYKAKADIESETLINAGSGGNLMAAGDDLDAGSIVAQDSEIEYTENSDVNGFDLVLDCACAEGSSGDNVQEWEDTDDSVATQLDDSQKDVNIESKLKIEEKNKLELNQTTGGNAAVAGGDLGEDSPVTINAGKSSVRVTRNMFRNLSTVSF